MTFLSLLPAMPTATARVHVLSLAWLNIKRIARGWRWRSLVLISGAAAYWFTRLVDFGEGSAVWFPGGENGVTGFTLFLRPLGGRHGG
jgi:hypothetical protein